MSAFEIHKQNELRKREIEVKALVALMRFGRTHGRKVEAESRLCEIAFPETLAEKIEQETLTLSGNILEIDL